MPCQQHGFSQNIKKEVFFITNSKYISMFIFYSEIYLFLLPLQTGNLRHIKNIDKL